MVKLILTLICLGVFTFILWLSASSRARTVRYLERESFLCPECDRHLGMGWDMGKPHHSCGCGWKK